VETVGKGHIKKHMMNVFETKRIHFISLTSIGFLVGA
jgi:hypothetical protein